MITYVSYLIAACKAQVAVDGKNDQQTESKSDQSESPVSVDARFKYPEFLPHPWQPWRNKIREKLERSDMLKRRSRINIPEFYVGWWNIQIMET